MEKGIGGGKVNAIPVNTTVLKHFLLSRNKNKTIHTLRNAIGTDSTTSGVPDSASRQAGTISHDIKNARRSVSTGPAARSAARRRAARNAPFLNNDNPDDGNRSRADQSPCQRDVFDHLHSH